MNLQKFQFLFLILGFILAGVHPASAADGPTEFDYPLAVAVDPAGTIYVADRNLPGVWKISEGKRELFFQGSKKFRTPLNAIRCLAIDKQGNLLAGDSATREVYRFEDGKPVPLTMGGIGIPMAIDVDSQGDLFVADLELHRIWKVPAAGGRPVEFAQVPAPRGLTIDDEDRLWIVSHGKNQVVRITPDGKQETVVEGRPFEFPHNIVLDENQTAYVSDGYADTIWKIAPSEPPQKWISGKPLQNPVGLAWKGETLLIVDPHAKAIFTADSEGTLKPMELK